MTKYVSDGGMIVQVNPDVPPTGSDLGIVNAARKSFGKRSSWDWTCVRGCTGPNIPCTKECEVVNLRKGNNKLKPADKRLLGFLARGMTSDDFDNFVNNVVAPDTEEHKMELIDLLWQWRHTPTHDTPINHGFFSFEIKVPIFVRAQLVKSEYTILSEYSRRYITDDVEFYQHTYRNKSEDKKQGSTGIHPEGGHWSKKTDLFRKDALDLYNSMVQSGVAPEQARGCLPQDLMTSATWSGTFGAFAKMCQLRLASDAQAETRWVAECIYEELKKQFPVAAPMFVKGEF